jgi:hypothetical protein
MAANGRYDTQIKNALTSAAKIKKRVASRFFLSKSKDMDVE